LVEIVLDIISRGKDKYMDTKEGIEIIKGIIQSIQDNPSQFHIDVKVIGQQISSYGGTGLIITATGGGPGSTTIGQNVSVNGSQIKIAQQRGNQAIQQQFEALIRVLQEISQQLESSSPDKSKIQCLYQSIKNTWVPGIITSVVGSVLSQYCMAR
jgi:hypothetical protein